MFTFWFGIASKHCAVWCANRKLGIPTGQFNMLKMIGQEVSSNVQLIEISWENTIFHILVSNRDSDV